MKELLGVIGSLLLIVMGIWKYYGRKNAAKRKLADEAGEKLDTAQKNKDKSGRLDAWMRAKWMR
jgi:hypothetical protein